MPARRPLVLLAEDNCDLREYIAAQLIRAGLDVVEVEDGVELHEYLSTSCAQSPDVVVSDVDMPRLSGPDALARLKVRPPVILITANPTAALRTSSAKAGVLAILEKPFEVQALVARIKAIAGALDSVSIAVA